MSKLIVEKLQRSGGPEISLPTSQGAANSILINDGAGALSYNTIGSILPTASVANTYLTNDGSGNLSYNTIGRSLDESKDIVGMMMSRANWFSGYDATNATPGFSYGFDFDSGPIDGHTLQPSQAMVTNDNSQKMLWNMMMGDGAPDVASSKTFADMDSSTDVRQKRYSWGNRVGSYQIQYHGAQDTAGECGLTFSLMPIRNTSSADITATLGSMDTTEFSTYGGMSIGVYTPNATTYAATTAGTWSQLISNTDDATVLNSSLSITVPANKTVLLWKVTTHHYVTTYQFRDTHMYNELNTFFTPSNALYVDLRMLDAMCLYRKGISATSIDPSDLYPFCAASFGDR
jgi:hypothetical protein